MTQSNDRPLQILFVCIGNSCRSQMAEAWAKHHGNGKVQAFSAGSHPLGVIAAETYDVMREKGISLDGQSSKGVREVPVAEMDVLVGMGFEVTCPVPAGFQGRVVEWHVPDPYAHGMDTFRDVRDVIERHVLTLLAELIPPMPPRSR
ncbi:MAG: arsenate reductase ArsC [Acidobacteriia bacterium]|nr:arsenate reductase ArsC [Terriglobia bacterium]